MKHQNKFSVPRLLTPIALAVTLAACSTTSQTPLNLDVPQDPAQSAQAYVIQTDRAKGGTPNDLLLSAFKEAVAEHEMEPAANL